MRLWNWAFLPILRLWNANFLKKKKKGKFKVKVQGLEELRNSEMGDLGNDQEGVKKVVRATHTRIPFQVTSPGMDLEQMKQV